MEGSSGNSPAAAPLAFRNRYWILRHGRSVPNERGLIVSSLENGTKPEFGLAPQGVEQALSAGESLRKELEEMGVPVDSVKICYSPFSRTTETARVVAGVLGVPFDGPSCKATVDLRERYFGPSYELLSHEKYAEVWVIDEADPFLAPEGGESVADVASRLAEVLSSTDVEFHGSAVLIVSHGDPLQIFQAVLSGTKENPSFLDEATVELRERYFGPSYELLSHEKYAEVWAIDEADPFMAPEGGESVADVASRLAGLLSSTDVEFHGSAVLIVSHGDPLQIFQAVLSGTKENPSFLDEVTGLKKESLVVPSVLSQHRKFALNTGELRRVV